MIVKPDAPWKNFQEFVDYAKKNPRKIKYSTSGVGTGMHLAMEYIANKDGIQWIHIPYKSAAAARMALMGGHVDACSAGAEFVPFAKQGMVRVLATHGEKRSPAFPDVPTLKELGYDFVKETVFAMMGPAPLPPDVLKSWRPDSRRVRRAPSLFQFGINSTVCRLITTRPIMIST